MSNMKTTGIVISNKNHVGDRLPFPDADVQTVGRSLKKYNSHNSNRKNKVDLTLWVNGNVLSFRIFDDIKYLVGHKVTLVQDGELVIHVVNHTLGIKTYLGPESLCSYYETEADSNLTPKSIFTLLTAQLVAGVAGLGLMTLMSVIADYTGYLNSSSLNAWLINVLISIVVVLVTARLLFKKQNNVNTLGRYLSEYEGRLSNVFYLSTIWVYPVFSFAFQNQFLSLTALVALSLIILIIPALLTKGMISKHSESNCAVSAYKYEQSLQHYMTRISEQEKDVWLFAKAA